VEVADGDFALPAVFGYPEFGVLAGADLFVFVGGRDGCGEAEWF
jgi:hypothetical protein